MKMKMKVKGGAVVDPDSGKILILYLKYHWATFSFFILLKQIYIHVYSIV